MPSYNYAHYLPYALDALLAQTLPPLEIIIIDDASTDNSVSVIQSYQAKSPLIQLHQNPVNLGVIKTANLGIEKAKGDYIVFCAADDVVAPTFFEKSLRLLAAHPKAGFCSSRFSIFYGDDEENLQIYSQQLATKPGYISPEKFVQRVKFRDIHIGGLNNIFKKEAIIQTGKLLPELGPMCDWFLIKVLALRYGLCFVPEALAKMRIHSASYSTQKAQDPAFARGLFAQLNRLLDTPDYKDIKADFISSGLVYQLGLAIVPLMLKNRQFLNLPLVLHFFVAYLKKWKHALKQKWAKNTL